jgi:DNA-binding transcriptional MerR regulator
VCREKWEHFSATGRKDHLLDDAMTTGMQYFKPAEIADLAGLPEAEVREYLASYPDLFHYRSIGPARLYTATAVETVKRLSEAAKEGKKPEEAAEAVADEGPEPTPSPVVQAYAEARDLKDVVARQDAEIAALRSGLEDQRQVLEGRIASLEEALAAEKRKTALISDWVEYFDYEIALLKRPLLEKLFGKKS